MKEQVWNTTKIRQFYPLGVSDNLSRRPCIWLMCRTWHLKLLFWVSCDQRLCRSLDDMLPLLSPPPHSPKKKKKKKREREREREREKRSLLIKLFCFVKRYYCWGWSVSVAVHDRLVASRTSVHTHTASPITPSSCLPLAFHKKNVVDLRFISMEQ